MKFAGLLLIFVWAFTSSLFAQDLYTAKGYWEEVNKPVYKKILDKKMNGDSLSTSESVYLTDYQTYLATYFQHLPEEEKLKYETMKDQWNKEAQPISPTQDIPDFELRGRDRFRNGVYGFYYGISLVSITRVQDAAAGGIPLIMAGLWQLGPIINPKKYENITLATVRAGNTGKILGLGYGAALGLALGGDSENTGDLVLGLSTLGSIGLGEFGFQRQKKNQLSEGHIEMIRHYGFLGPGVALLGTASADPNDSRIAGVSLLAGGIGGLILGNRVAKRNNFSAGDVDAISSLTWITTGLGFTAVVNALDNADNSSSLYLVPAMAAIAGTVAGQYSLKDVHLTKKQGNTISLSSGGAALIGLGIVAIADSESPTAVIGVPSALALITHQLLLHSYKMKNLENKIKLGRVGNKRSMKFSLKVTPENYLINRQVPTRTYFSNGTLISNPLVSLKLTF